MRLITGTTGLVGSHLLARLLTDEPLDVRALYRSEKKKELALSMLRFCYPMAAEHLEKVEWQKVDILDIDRLHQAFVGVKEVYHCAGYVRVWHQ